MRCPRCQTDGVPDGATFCPACGTPLVAHAPDRRGATAPAPPPPAPPPPPRPGPLPEPQAWTQRVSPLVYIEGNDLPQASRRTTVLVALAFAFVGAGVWLAMSSETSSANWSPAPPPALSPVRARPAADSSARAEPAPAATLVVSRPPRPRPVPAPRVAAPVPRPAPLPAASAPPADAPPEPAVLSVSTWPWGTLSLDGRPVGDTPVLELQVSPGTHRVRIERDGFQPFERVITVAPGQNLKMTGIALEERSR